LVYIYHQGNMNISDDELFKDPPPKEDCEICMLPIPYAQSLCRVGKTYMPCCGKVLCSGCIIASFTEMEKGNMKQWCAFCRLPFPRTSGEFTKRYNNRMKVKDAEAFRMLGKCYLDGGGFVKKSINKAIELWNRAVELGSIGVHYYLATEYMEGRYVGRNPTIALHHFKMAAIGGHEKARYYLGLFEYDNGNHHRAMKHFMIAARSGYDDALKEVGMGYKAGHVTKDDYASTLRAYKESQDEMSSEQRTKAEMEFPFKD